jgi:hypothetical protein
MAAAGEAQGRILKFDGPEGFIEAAQELLYGPEDIHAAVIRGAGSAAMQGINRIPATTLASDVVRRSPGFDQVNAMIERWDRLYLPPYCHDAFFAVSPTSGGIPIHIDRTYVNAVDYLQGGRKEFEGPLTFSYRTDDFGTMPGDETPIVRRFYAERTHHPLLTDAGFDWAANEALDREREKRLDNGHATAGMLSTEQWPGDMVLFRNYPTPTWHVVEELDAASGQRAALIHPNRRTSAIIGRWFIEAELPPAED